MSNSTKPTSTFDDRKRLLARVASEHHQYLVCYVYSYCKHWQDAENIVQDLWKYAAAYLPDDKLDQIPLLRRKAYQLFIDHYRSSKRRPAIPTDEIPEPATKSKHPEAFTQDEEQVLKVRFFEQFPSIALTESQKEVLWLHARYGFTYEEIGAKLHIPVSTIGNWVTKARELIAEALHEEGKNNG